MYVEDDFEKDERLSEAEVKEHCEENGIDMLPDGELDAEIKKKYPKIYRVDIDIDELDESFTYYFKKPTTSSFNRVLKTFSKQSFVTMTAFTLECIVEEQKDFFKETITEYPGIAMTAGQKLLAMLGITDNVSLKKL